MLERPRLLSISTSIKARVTKSNNFKNAMGQLVMLMIIVYSHVTKCNFRCLFDTFTELLVKCSTEIRH